MAIDINQLELPKASPSAARALGIITAPEPDTRALEQAIMQDPILASTLLRYANSPLYRRPQEIANVPTALRLLGLKSVHSAIVNATMRALLPCDNALARRILEHMTTTSMLCRIIARHCCRAAADDLEFLGLIHDVGMLVLAVNFSGPYECIVATALNEALEIDRLELDEFGLTHDPVGARVARDFRLPARHAELLAGFHSREPLAAVTDERTRDTAILALAHRLLRERIGADPQLPETIAESAAQLQTLLALSAETVDAIIEEYTQIAAGNEASD